MPGQYKEYEKLNLPEIGQIGTGSMEIHRIHFKKVLICGKGKHLLFFMKVPQVPTVCPVFTM